MAKNGHNGKKWQKMAIMVKNGQKQQKMDENDQKWP